MRHGSADSRKSALTTTRETGAVRMTAPFDPVRISGYVPGDILAELDGPLRDRIVARLQDDPTFSDELAREIEEK